METPKLYSIVIPVYGTSRSLVEIAERMKTLFSTMPNKRYELIYVNDCSPNKETMQTLQHIFAGDPNVCVISFSKNFGQQAATLCGIHHAKGDYVITMDDDLQHKPEDIPLLMTQEDHDVVIACFSEKKHSLFKRLTSRVKGWFDHVILKKPKDLQLTSFRLMNRTIANGLLASKTPYPFIPAMLYRITSDFVNVTVPHYNRLDGHSQYTIWKLINLFSNLLVNNSFLLLRTLGVIGIGGFLFSVLIAGYLVIRHFYSGFGVTGWASTILAVVFFGGLILFGIGTVGEYLLRILLNLEQNNMYFIKKVHKHDS